MKLTEAGKPKFRKCPRKKKTGTKKRRRGNPRLVVQSCHNPIPTGHPNLLNINA